MASMNCENKNYVLVSDFNFDTDKETTQWDEIIDDGGGVNTPTSTWLIDGYVEMKVPDVGDRIVRQTTEYYRTKGGKMTKAQFTAVLNINTIASTDVSGSISRVGVFDNHDDKTVLVGDVGNTGFFFEYRVTDTTTLGAGIPTHPLYVGIRYGTTDAGTDTLIRQDEFNINDLNRNSHLKIVDWSKIYTFEIMYNSIGFVEWAVYLDGERIVLHREQNVASILNKLPSFNAPLRVEITNSDTLSAGLLHEMRHFHSSIYIEDYDGFGDTEQSVIYKLKHLTDISNLVYTIDSNSYIPIFSFRLKEEFVRNPIKLYEILYLVHRHGPFSYAIVKDVDLSTGNSPVWIDAGSDKTIEYDITANVATSITDVLYEQYVDRNSLCNRNNSKILVGPAVLTSDIGGTAHIFTLLVRKLGQEKVTVNFGLRWAE